MFSIFINAYSNNSIGLASFISKNKTQGHFAAFRTIAVNPGRFFVDREKEVKGGILSGFSGIAEGLGVS